MSSVPATDTGPIHVTWPHRVRFVAGVALLWAGLHFVIDQTVLARGAERPVIIAVTQTGWLAAPATALLLWIGAFLATRLAGGRDGCSALLLVGFALSIWATEGGTMDRWLVFKNEAVTPAGGTSAAYWPLIIEYVFLLACVAGAALAGGLAALGTRARDADARRRCLHETFADPTEAGWLRKGLTATVVTLAIAAPILMILAGPRAAWTRHFQVIFATGAAFAVGTGLSVRLVGLARPMWYWIAPILLGVIGAIAAAVSPTLPQPHEGLSNIPSSALTRPLPVQMVGVGLVATIWAYRAATQHPRRNEKS